MLMMSATPIPRTLAMSYYADLDVSTLDELPPGRTPVVTKLIAETRETNSSLVSANNSKKAVRSTGSVRS